MEHQICNVSIITLFPVKFGLKGLRTDDMKIGQGLTILDFVSNPHTAWTALLQAFPNPRDIYCMLSSFNRCS